MTDPEQAPCGQQEKHDLWESLGFPCPRCLAEVIAPVVREVVAERLRSVTQIADAAIAKAKKQ